MLELWFPFSCLVILMLILFNPLFWILIPLLFLVSIMLFSYEFVLFSMGGWWELPRHLWNLWRDPRLRKNHALCHATLNILEEEGISARPKGMAQEVGFYVNLPEGIMSPDAIMEAAQRGRKRVLSGDHALMVHRGCATANMTSGFMLFLIMLVLMFFLRFFSPFAVVIAAVVSYLFAAPFSPLVQKWFFVTPELSDIEITGVQAAPFVRHFEIPIPLVPGRHFVSTRLIKPIRRLP